MSSPAAELHQMAAIGRLLASVVHEINTPLGAIFSNTEVIVRSLELMQPLLADGSPEALEKAGRLAATCQNLAAVDRIACERIRSIIRGLKTLSRTDAGEPRRTDLNRLVLDTLKLTEAEFGRRISVETELGELPEVECYPQLLAQVLLNLLVNAGQAIEGEGVIRVTTGIEDGAVHIAVADSGRGMSPEEQARAFRAGFTTKPVGEGAGMGLAISREIVEETHGGAIGFESQPGKGATFHVRIPLRQTRRMGV
ncbi:MAG TPA: HAMP domain-containing sensor histidine kinase [Bryobacteraceae bacterium]|jgi:signal transduction histidine kinase|nr:HAMP domain-containing sensor histidine kinase [Bryobacteraceae bacterium]